MYAVLGLGCSGGGATHDPTAETPSAGGSGGSTAEPTDASMLPLQDAATSSDSGASMMDARAGQDTDAASGDATVGALELCTGTDDIVLIVEEGFRSDWPKSVLYERGGRTFALDGKCNLYLQTDAWEPIHQRALTPADVEQLREALKLDAWGSLVDTYCHILSTDEAGFRIWLGGLSLEPQSCVPAASPNPRILTGMYARQHYSEGQPVSGPVRYVLVEDPTDQPSNYVANALPWPLGDVELAASELPIGGAHDAVAQRAQVRVAQGAQAETLRALRREYLDGEVGDTGSEFLPIREQDGTVYRLYMRDTLPHEDGGGAIELP